MFNKDDYPHIVCIRTTLPVPNDIAELFVNSVGTMVILERHNIPFSDNVLVRYAFSNSDDAIFFKLRFG